MKYVCFNSIHRMLLDVVQRSQLQTSHSRDRDIIFFLCQEYLTYILILDSSFVLQGIVLAYANNLALMKNNYF